MGWIQQELSRFFQWEKVQRLNQRVGVGSGPGLKMWKSDISQNCVSSQGLSILIIDCFSWQILIGNVPFSRFSRSSILLTVNYPSMKFKKKGLGLTLTFLVKKSVQHQNFPLCLAFCETKYKTDLLQNLIRSKS